MYTVDGYVSAGLGRSNLGDASDRIAVGRICRIESLYTAPDGTQLAYCQPLSAGRATAGDSGLVPFHADLNDFPSRGQAYRLVSFDRAWPAVSEGPLETPIGSFFRQGDRFFWNDVDGGSYITGPGGRGLLQWVPQDGHLQDGEWVEVAPAAEFAVADLGGFTRRVHQRVYGIGASDAQDEWD